MTVDARNLTAPAPTPAARGLFVTFEGGDSAGKSTQIRLLREHLVKRCGLPGSAVVTTREPGGTPLGAELRQLILHGDHVAPRAEALLYAADRAHHVATVVRPHLDAGGVVLGDRYLDSSVAYQGAGRALDPAQVGALSLWATDGLLPHRTILLDIPPSVIAHRREAGSLDRLERAGKDFHEAVREQFLALAAADPARWCVIDGSGTREQVHAAILAALAPQLDAFTAAPATGDPAASDHAPVIDEARA